MQIAYTKEFGKVRNLNDNVKEFPQVRFDFYVSKIMHLWVRNLPRKPNN